MKRKLLLISFIVSLLITNFTIKAQIINQPANWPNASWTITGTYTASGFASDPTATSNFSWDDDLAGSGSQFDDISAESPQINLAAAVSGGEAQLQVSFDYVYRRVGDTIYLEWWDGSTWQIWAQLANNSSNLDYKGCTGFQSFVSQPLTISTLTATQLIEFKYRIHYNDSGFDWGFCMGSPTIISIATPACMEVSAINIDAANITESTASVDWNDNNGLPPANGWEIEYGPAGFAQGTGTVVPVAAHPYTLSGLTSSTNYDVYVRALCSAAEQSGWIGPVSFTTLLDVIGCGDQYVDSGGVGGNYSNDEDITQTFCPDVAGEVVTVQFLTFETENCCDYLRIYNGDSAAAPLLGEYRGTDMPPRYTSTDATGCLTFVFVSDFSNTRGGWTADITCDLPPTCLAPDTLAVSNITMDSADFTWNDINATAPANGWEIVIVPAGQSPDLGTPVAVANSPYLATGLNPSTLYDFYVRAVCDNAGTVDPSFWTGPLNFATDIAPPVCGGNFVDSGGPGGLYSNNEDTTTTICPVNAGDVVTIQFLEFETENCCDYLRIYDGDSAAAPLLGEYRGTNMPPLLTSTHATGCLTFVFHSDGSVTSGGWLANILCGPPPTCFPPNAITITNLNHNSADFSWNDNNTPAPLNGWMIEIVPAGTTPTGVGTAVALENYTATGLNPDTDYDFYVWAICDNAGVVDPSMMAGPLSFHTEIAPPACGGIFTDDGGTANNYSNGQDTTTVICPENAGDIVSVEFTMFDTEAGWDDMTIYDGDTATGTPLGVYDGTTLPPTFISTHPSGCLTFVFHSDGIINRPGWEANVICMPEPTCWFVTNVNTGATTTTSVSVSWTDALNTPAPAGGWDIEYGTVGFTPGTGAGTVVNAASSPFVVTGLSPSTNYDFYVSARCAADGSDSATWAGPVVGRTDDAPPPNDTCATAIPINTNLTCIPIMGNNILATSSSALEGEVTPDCADPFINNPANVLDVWFSFVVPNTNAFIIETSNAGGMVDSIMSAYSGSCGNLVELDCQDDSVIDPNSDNFRFSSITLRNLTVGETIYIRVWSAPAYTSAGTVHPNVQGAFNICVMDTGAGRSGSNLGFGDVQIEYHPNPVKDNLVIKANATISNVSVYNILGEQIISNTYNTKEVNLNTNILSSGTYFVRSLVLGKVKMFKIIKE